MNSPLTPVQLALLGSPSPYGAVPIDDEGSRASMQLLVRVGLIAVDDDGVYYRTHAGSRYVEFLARQSRSPVGAKTDDNLPPSDG
jgi:hypothetical protein